MAFFGIYGVYAPKQTASLASSSSMDNEVREARTVNLGEDSLVGVSHVSSFKQEIMKKITKLELENSVLRGDIIRLKKRVNDMVPQRILSAASGSSVENEARTVNIKKDDLAGVSRASSLEEEILQKVTKLEVENRVLKGYIVKLRMRVDNLNEKLDSVLRIFVR